MGMERVLKGVRGGAQKDERVAQKDERVAEIDWEYLRSLDWSSERGASEETEIRRKRNVCVKYILHICLNHTVGNGQTMPQSTKGRIKNAIRSDPVYKRVEELCQ